MEKIKKFIYIGPFLIYISLFFLYGLYYVFMTSLGYNRITEKSFFTLDFYKDILFDKEIYEIIRYTTNLNLIAGFLSLILTIIILYILFISRREGYFNNKVFQKIVEAPVFVPYLIAAYGILILFMRRGIINQVLYRFNLIDNINNFPILTNDEYGIGIIITYIWKTLPFMIMMTAPTVFKIDDKWKRLATIYDLKNFIFFQKIIFPLIVPTLSASFFIVIAFLFASFETPFILGMTYPRVLAVEIFNLYTRSGLDTRGKIMVLNILIAIISLFFGGIMYYLTKRFSKVDNMRW